MVLPWRGHGWFINAFANGFKKLVWHDWRFRRRVVICVGWFQSCRFILFWFCLCPTAQANHSLNNSKKKTLRSYSKKDLTYDLVPRAIWPYYVKWKFSTFCGLSRSTTYPYLPQRRLDPLDPHSYPQGGVQILGAPFKTKLAPQIHM